MDGLTYETKSQAETAVQDYRTEGKTAKYIVMPDGTYKVFITGGEPTVKKRRTATSLVAGRRAQREAEKIVEKGEITALEKEYVAEGGASPKETWKELYRKKIVKMPYEAWLREEPEQRALDIAKAQKEVGLARRLEQLQKIVALRERQGYPDAEITPVKNEEGEVVDYTLAQLPPKFTTKLEQQKQSLAKEQASLKSWGIEPGVVTEVRDKTTGEVTGYKLTYPEGRPGVRRIKKGIMDAPVTSLHATGKLVEEISKSIDVKRGMQASIPGQAPSPRAIIAALPQRETGSIGATRPAIGEIGQVDMSKIGKSYMEQPEELAKSPLSNLPRAKKLTVNGQQDTGFAVMPIIKKPNVSTK